jgi:hypothetical protein
MAADVGLLAHAHRLLQITGQSPRLEIQIDADEGQTGLELGRHVHVADHHGVVLDPVQVMDPCAKRRRRTIKFTTPMIFGKKTTNSEWSPR